MTHDTNNTADPTAGQARPPKPVPLPVIPGDIPAELTTLDQWVFWRYSWIEKRHIWDKPPFQSHSGNLADSSKPKTWSGFEAALDAYHFEGSHADGIGFMFAKDNKKVGGDLDDCRDPQTGTIEPWAQEIIDQVNTYTEISTSGTGVHFIAEGHLLGRGLHVGNIELYDTGRYFCTTGHHLPGTPLTIESRQEAITELYQHLRDKQAGGKKRPAPSNNGTNRSPDLDDDTIIQKALGAKNGQKFAKLWAGEFDNYHSQSEADLALCRELVYWTEDSQQMDRIFRRSGLMRDKWDNHPTYAEWTMTKAIETPHDRYQGVSVESNGQPHDECNASSNSDTPPTTLTDVEQVFRKWLDLPDIGLVHVQLGTIAANLIPDADPVWLMEIGGSGWGKTENLQSASALPFVHVAATLTEAALLSGTPRKDKSSDAKGGLLKQMDPFGLLILKDFTSILSMHRDGRAAVLAALREIYDGSWTRHVGVDGGRTLHWSGKIGVIAGVTSTIDRHHSVISTMGERFIFYRLPQPDEQKQAEQGLRNVGKEKVMRAELAAAVKSLFANLVVPTTAATLSPEETQQLIAWARLAARCRSPIERDSYSREIELIPDPEAPVRLAQILLRLLTGMLAVGVPRADAWKIIRKVTFDCMPAIRCKVLQFLLISPDPQRSTTDIATKLGYPTETARRALEDLAAHNILTRTSQGKGKPDLWKLSTLAQQLTGSSPEMSKGTYTDEAHAL